MTDIDLQVRSTLDDAPVDDVVDVYRDAFTAPGYDETPEDVARFREGPPGTRRGTASGWPWPGTATAAA